MYYVETQHLMYQYYMLINFHWVYADSSEFYAQNYVMIKILTDTNKNSYSGIIIQT